MSKNSVLDVTVLIQLKADGMSVQQMANRFQVAPRTIKRKLQKQSAAPEVLSFAAKLEKMIADAPSGLCKKDLQRMIQLLRSPRHVSRDGRKAQVVESLSTGAQTVEDICDDLGLNKEDIAVFRAELVEILDELIVANVVFRQAPGGVGNRGRKIKFKYFLVV